MRIETCFTAIAVTDAKVIGKTVVVIDVLRATSVIVTALYNGCKAIYPVKEVEDGFALKASMPEALLCGERNADKIPGFDLGNSPLDFIPELVMGKDIILTTTNGTLALERSSKAETVLIGSFLNGNAVARIIMAQNLDVVLVCAGTNGNFSLDDGLCAGFIAHQMLLIDPEIRFDDATLALEMLWQQHATDIYDALKQCHHVNILKDKGYAFDLDYALNVGDINRVPMMKENRIQ